MTTPNYVPSQLYPGSTGSRPNYIATPARTYTAGPRLDGIEQRWRTLQASGISYDPALTDFLQGDISQLMTIARAAYHMVTATNAESHRQAAEQLRYSLQ